MEEGTLKNSSSKDSNIVNNGQQQQQQPLSTAMDHLCRSDDQFVSKLRELARQQQQDMLLKQQMTNSNNSSNGSTISGNNIIISNNNSAQQSSSSPLANLPLPLLAHAASFPVASNTVSTPFLPGTSCLASPSNGSSGISFSPNATNNINNSSSNNSIHNSSSSSSGSTNNIPGSTSSIRHFKKKALTMQASPSPSPPPPPAPAEPELPASASQCEVKLKLVPYEEDDEDTADKATNGSGDNSNKSKPETEVTAALLGNQNGKQVETDSVKADKVAKVKETSTENLFSSTSKPTATVSNKRPAEPDEEEMISDSNRKQSQSPSPKLTEPLSVSTAANKSLSKSTSSSTTPADTEPLQELKVLLLSPTLPTRSKSSPAAVEQAEKASPPVPKKMKKSIADNSSHHQQETPDFEVSFEEASSEVSATSSLEMAGDGTSQETATDISGKTDTDDETCSIGGGGGGIGKEGGGKGKKNTRARGRNHSSASATSATEGTANFSISSDVEMKELRNEQSSLLAAISAAVTANQSASTSSDSFDFLRPSSTISATTPGSQQQHSHHHLPGSSAAPHFSSTPNSRGRRTSTSALNAHHLSLLQGSPFSPIGGSNGNNSSNNSSSSFTTLPEMPTMVTHVGRKPLNGPPCSLKTLVDDGILDPLDGSLTYEILGSKFTGDLLPNGFIRMSASLQIFANPSSWANFCRSTIPNAIKEGKNYGSAWSIIRYLGKRLDSYKLRWYRKQKKSFGGGGSPSASPSPHSSPSTSGLNPAQMMQLMTGGAGGTGAGGSLGTFHPHHQLHHHPHSNSRRSATATSAEQLSYTAQLLGLPMGNMGTTGHHHPHHHMTGGGKGNIYSYMNRERLYKLDKISLGDTELNGENINDPNEVVNFASIDLNSRDCLQREDMKVEAVPFAVTGGLQPFLVTVMTNVLMLVDFHAHVVPNEVCGFLGGTWDPRTQHMVITSAYPLMYACTSKKLGATTAAADSAEQAKQRAEAIGRIKSTMRDRGTVLVGWYHSHVKSSPHPTILDIKKQLRYQKEFLVSPSQQKSAGKSSFPTADYSPVVGLIVSPYYPRTQRLVSLMQMFWVAPIYVSAVKDFGRPMQFNFTVTRDAFLTQDLLVEMRAVATHYFKKGDFVPFREKYREGVTFWEKLHESMKPKLPRDLIEYVSNEDLANEICAQALVHFWTFVRSLLTLDKNPEDSSSNNGDKKSPEKRTEKGNKSEKEKNKEIDKNKGTDSGTEKSVKTDKSKVVEATAAITT